MSLENIFGISASGLSAQQIRLNTTASNLANANNVASSPEQAYRAKIPVFESIYNQQLSFNGQNISQGVKVAGIAESKATIESRFQPGHPMADDKGYVYATNVNTIEETANMISASRDYQSNIEIMDTAKNLLLRTIDILNR